MQVIPFFSSGRQICIVHPGVSGSEALSPASPVLKVTLLFSVQMSGGWYKGRLHGVINII